MSPFKSNVETENWAKKEMGYLLDNKKYKIKQESN